MSLSFDEQLDAVESLYGQRIHFTFTAKKGERDTGGGALLLRSGKAACRADPPGANEKIPILV